MKLSMDVVCAVIKSVDVINKGRNDLFLIAKCAKNKIHAGKWEFPGGKAKHEENHSDAVKREVMEELGVEIEITGLQDPIKHSYKHVKSGSCHMSVNSPTTAQSPKQRKWSTWS
jgi:mutator protein MutT